MKRFVPWLLFIAVISVVSHILIILFIPNALMALVMYSASSKDSALNQLQIPERISATSRKIVRSAPDLAYAFCVYDLNQGPVLATLNASETYASLSIFADNTDNVFAINDLAVTGKAVKLVLINNETDIELANDVRAIKVPSEKGLILWRRVIVSDADWPHADATRREVICAPYQ